MALLPIDEQLLVPGQDYALRVNESGEPEMCQSLAANLHRYQLFENLRLGGRRMIDPPSDTLHPVTGSTLPDGSYLERLSGETTYEGKDPFIERKNRASHRPICQRIINSYVSTLDRQPVDRSDLYDAFSADPRLLSDVDKRGSSAKSFVLENGRVAWSQGWCGTMCHLPKKSSAQSRGDQIRMGLRPWGEVISPQRIFQYEFDGDGRLHMVLIEEGTERWRLWTDLGWVLYGKDMKELERGTHPFGRVPMEILYALEPDTYDAEAPLGRSPIDAAADLEIEAFRAWSLHCRSEARGNFQILHAQIDPALLGDDREAETVAGDGWIMYFPGTLSYATPDPSILQENRNHLADIEDQALKAGGVHRRSQDSTEAHSGASLEWEYQPMTAHILYLAGRLEDWERRWWDLYAMGAGVDDLPEDPITYPREITTSPPDVLVQRASSVVAVYGGYAAASPVAQAYVDDLMERTIKQEVGDAARAQKILSTKPQEESSEDGIQDERSDDLQSPAGDRDV